MTTQHFHRRSVRLKNYDYAQAGAYFVTVCTQSRTCLFGEIVANEMRLNDLGRIVAEEWVKSADIRSEIEMDSWVVMPNHLHGVVILDDPRAHGRAPQHRSSCQELVRAPRSLGSFVAGFKSAATLRINEIHRTPGAKVWQRSYWERVVRSETELNLIREYIQNNPAQWELDTLHPDSGTQAGARETSPMYGAIG